MSRYVELAKDVVAHLNSSEFSQSFEATFRLVPIFKLEELSTLRVSVLLNQVTHERVTRNSWTDTVDVYVAIQKQSDGCEDDAQALVTLAEEVLDDLHDVSFANGKFIKIGWRQVYDAGQLDKGCFTAVVVVTYKILLEGNA